MTVDQIEPGTRIKITQTINRQAGDWTAEVVGTVVEIRDAPTGSWYAHGKNGKYWLKRLLLQKDDGEISTFTLDADSRIVLVHGSDS